MKTELRVKAHSVIPGQVVIELWHAGEFIGTIAGADGPGVRVITKHAITAKPGPDDPTMKTADGRMVNVLEVAIAAE